LNFQPNIMTILIVDDIPQNIQVAGSMLKEAGFEISFAQSGYNALEQASNYMYDLILLDVMMPGMNGFEVCERLKSNEKTKDIPVIFLTALNENENIRRAFQVGGVDYITKPFNCDELVIRVSTHIELSQQRKELKEMSDLKNKIFSILAHDMKNPFVTILSFCDMLYNGFLENDKEEFEKAINLLYDSAKQGYYLLDNLLHWSNSQINRINFSPVVFDLNKIVVETFDLTKFSANLKNITLENHLMENTIVFADENMIRIVLRNLISNAIKFTENGGMVGVNVVEKNNQFIKLQIEDNGIGIRSEKIEKLFKLETHFSTEGTSKEKGTGIGLILCNEFMRAHGGNIEVKSEEGKGTRFIFSLSLNQN